MEARIAATTERLNELNEALERLEGYERIANPLREGLQEIAEQLKPLRQLPRRTDRLGLELPDETVDALEGLRASLVQPRWDGAGRIPMEDGLPFFGQVPDQETADDDDQFPRSS
jgi:hypothetical protein